MRDMSFSQTSSASRHDAEDFSAFAGSASGRIGHDALGRADHGNAEIMFDAETEGPYTAHSLNPVPFILVDENYKNMQLRKGGALKDIAPTILSLMGLRVPAEMEGVSLLLPDT